MELTTEMYPTQLSPQSCKAVKLFSGNMDTHHLSD